MSAYAPMTCRICGYEIDPTSSYSIGSDHVRWRQATKRAHTAVLRAAPLTPILQNPEARVRITRTPEDNVPRQVRDGLDETLRKSRSEPDEHQEQAPEILFRNLRGCRFMDSLEFPLSARRARRSVGNSAARRSQPLALGSACFWLGRGRGICRLGASFERLGERERRRSEPDGIIAWRAHVAFVEAKYQSPNPPQPEYKHFATYLDRPELFRVSTEEVAAAGHYELVRNWRIGIEVAERLGADTFTLVNLGPSRSRIAQSRSLPAWQRRETGASFTGHGPK